MLVPLARAGGVTVTIEAAEGELALAWNGVPACTLALPARRTCAVPRERTRAGVNVLTLEAGAPVLVRAVTVTAAGGRG
jgi:hypothetical protein